MPNTDSKPLDEIKTDAVFLHGLCQGVGILYDEFDSASTPASNATYTLICEIIRKAERLADDIDAAETQARTMERALRRSEFKAEENGD